MKVGRTSKLKSGETPAHSGRSAGRASSVLGASGAGGTFADVAGAVEARAIIEELEALGSLLSRFPTSALLGRYKELVRMALARVKDGMRVKREFKWRRTERSMFMVIERVEEALSELEELESALGRESERTRMFSLIDEIKGCLISLLL
jgi:uncharacterized protein YaaR (DUF327 family)